MPLTNSQGHEDFRYLLKTRISDQDKYVKPDDRA